MSTCQCLCCWGDGCTPISIGSFISASESQCYVNACSANFAACNSSDDFTAWVIATFVPDTSGAYGAGGAGVLVIIGLLLYYFYRKNKQKTQNAVVPDVEAAAVPETEDVIPIKVEVDDNGTPIKPTEAPSKPPSYTVSNGQKVEILSGVIKLTTAIVEASNKSPSK
ncbi:hypothetical protein HDU92_001174 [Lobulomyces angularis]|nr:hypothetical protein HDU92_001174 [Lobulomyces angularis]